MDSMNETRNPLATAEYISCAETAKLLRKALRDAFPGQKFSVRSDTYSMGASIHVSYVGEWDEAAVHVVTDRYEGGSFDGMTDSKTYRTITLDDGRIVQPGADFIFVNRRTA